MTFPASVYAKPTTLNALREAGILLCEEPGEHAILRVVCFLAPGSVAGKQVVYVGHTVQIQRADNEWADIMAHLPEGEADDANEGRAEALFGATPEDLREMLQRAMKAGVAMRSPRRHHFDG